MSLVPPLSDLLKPDPEELVEHYPNPAERAADWWVHAVGLAGAVVGGVLLLGFSLLRGGFSLAAATACYAACLIAMLACSAAYNLTRPSPARRLLRRLDEAAIFLLIAGSYTPFTAQRFDWPWDLLVTAGVWTLALLGVAGKLLMPRLPERFWCAVYVAFGWIAVLALGPMIARIPPAALMLLATGGFVYTLGVPVFLNPKVPFRRAVWHGFVVFAAAMHYGAVWTGVVWA
jgi:hemolysin III